MPDTPATPGPPPGWYADSPGAARLRWWNGSTWTDHYTERTPAPTAPPAPAAKPEPEPTEWMPDLVLTREPRGADRMPRPVTFTPNTSTGSSPWSPAPQGTFPASRGNPAATLSLALIVLALVGGIATFWWLDAAYPRIAELTRVAVAVVAIAAMLLAVVAVAVAPRRNAHLAPAVIALVVSVLLVVALIAWFVLRLLGSGAVIGAPTPEQRFVTEVRAQVDTTQSDDELLALGEWTCEAIEGGKMALAAVIVGSGMSSYQVGVVAGVATTHLCPDLADEMEAILDSVETGG